MFFDTHVHITLPSQRVLHHKLGIEDYNSNLQQAGDGKGILFINPFDDKYCCPNSLNDNRLHKSIVRNISRNVYCVSCECCKTIHYVGEDIFRENNIELLKLAKDHNMFALAFLTAPDLSIQRQVDFYENNYPDFLGYKIHPTISMFPADKLHIYSKKTIVFHSGNDKFASPRQIVKFAENYLGNVVIAHFARFDKQVLKEISNIKNVWIDMSPFTFLCSLIRTKPYQLCGDWGNAENKYEPTYIFNEVASIVGYEKIIFASDAPFGSLTDEMLFLNKMNLDSRSKVQIKEKNAELAFNLI